VDGREGQGGKGEQYQRGRILRTHRSRLEIFDGVGHYPHVEAPALFTKLLTEFIETTVPAQIEISPRLVLGSTTE
jgi:hypothetical protein